ncbi:MAG: hypothetical protein K0B81_09355 [Candidatus Cloacimonetes bacterium]|nr:hypothetical protein [Candidatus Cloacimonadota bacterium]
MKCLFIIMIALLILCCNTIRDERFIASDDPPDDEGFYLAQSGSFVLRYKVDDTQNLECIFSANSTGWISVGFNPTNRMKDANIIIGYVEEGIGFIRDDFGTGEVSHEADTLLGGTNDVTLIAASEQGGRTTFHFRIPLDSGDPYDRVLVPGSSYPVIFARGNDNDFDSYHTGLGQAIITIR